GGAHATIVPDVPVVFETPALFPRPRVPTIAAVCSFDGDEPTDAIFAAAARLPHVHFVMTRNHSALPHRLKRSLPPTVQLAGFPPTPESGGLLRAADAVLDLTTLDHTMLRGAYEAVYQGTPVIVSDWPLLREEFPIGAVHVDNSVESIVDAVRDVERRHAA